MEKFRHTIRLTIDSDGPIQRSREFFSIRIAPLTWLSLAVNVAAFLLALRDVARTIEADWSAGVGIILAAVVPLRVVYATG